MDIFFAFVILLNASLLIAGGYYVWKAPEYLQRFMEEAVRKQDDRLRKRFGVVNNGTQAEQTEQTEAASEANSRRRRSSQRQAGQSVRRRPHTNPDS